MILDLLKDDRANCYSLMVQMTINEYLDKIQSSFEKKGGLEGQRETIKTKTAQKIRERMIEDLRNGAILPPIVLGAILDSEQIEVLNTENLKHEVINSDNLSKLVERIPKEDLFIIDGMQRTTALSEARKEKLKINEKLIRVEYWLASEVNSITYRMLVLNTSQIPWNLRRQLEVVYSSIVKELKFYLSEVGNQDFQIIEVDDSFRRSKAGQFHADDLIECYIVFGARKEKVDLQHELLEDQFLKNDFIEGVGNPSFNKWFYQIIDYLVRLDKIFSRYPNKDTALYDDRENLEEREAWQGRKVFASQPACIGFVTAFSIAIMGELGNDYDLERQNYNWQKIQKNMDKFLDKLSSKSGEEIGSFLDLHLLNELTTKNTGNTRTRGYKQREFYKEAFSKLIKSDFEVSSMTVCWRAY